MESLLRRLAEGKQGRILSWWGHTAERLVVLAVEVGGRWLDETRSFLSQLAAPKPEERPR